MPPGISRYCIALSKKGAMFFILTVKTYLQRSYRGRLYNKLNGTLMGVFVRVCVGLCVCVCVCVCVVLHVNDGLSSGRIFTTNTGLKTKKKTAQTKKGKQRHSARLGQLVRAYAKYFYCSGSPSLHAV